MVLSFLLRDTHVDKIEGVRQTSRQYCKANTSRLYQPRVVGFRRNRPHQASVSDKVLAHKAHWNAQTELRGLREKAK